MSSPPAAAGRTSARDIRRFWRTVQEPPSLPKRLEPVYYVFLALAIGGPFVYGTAREALAEVATPRAVSIWGPSLALAVLLAVLRWGAVQGPVVFSTADVAQLLGAPVRRAELVLGRLVRGLLIGAGIAAVVAGLVVVGLAGDGRGVDAGRAAAFVVALGLLGLLGVAGASLVQGSARWDRATRLARWPLVAAAVGLVVLASSGATGRHVALWSGPWGWAVQPLVGDAWPAAGALLLATTAGVTALALARRGAASTERHLARAEARDGAKAAVYSMNARFVQRSLANVGAGPAPARRASRIPLPGSPRLAIVWRDAVAALNAPQRLGEALVLATAGTAVCLVNAARPAAVAGGAFATYAGATRLLEPLRAETDKPSRVRVLLRAPMGRVLVQHAFVPSLVVLAGGLLAVIGCAVAGELPAHAGPIAFLALLATVSVTLCAALNGRRGGQVPSSLMAVTYGDTSGMSGLVLVLWLVAFPALAIALAAIPLSLVAHHGTDDLPQMAAVLFAAPLVLVASLGWEGVGPPARIADR
ncbi:MAG: hypothetical protein QOG77_2260 [Solirubrobacteraceae bacterium]|nr:hypothetical protein [Solirubrobacteraceae bacterium]